MGIGPGYRYRNKNSPRIETEPNNNPDPKNFQILEEQPVANFLVLKVKYPDATNYEGVKIVVYSGFNSSADLLIATKGLLDPHFSHDVSPIARFKPDCWEMAIDFALWALSPTAPRQ
jgi:hypothetical protein